MYLFYFSISPKQSSEHTCINVCTLYNTINVICIFFVYKVYQLDGTTLGKDWVMKTYHDIFVKFVDEHRHEFSGGKVIYSGLRSVELRRR